MFNLWPSSHNSLPLHKYLNISILSLYPSIQVILLKTIYLQYAIMVMYVSVIYVPSCNQYLLMLYVPYIFHNLPLYMVYVQTQRYRCADFEVNQTLCTLPAILHSPDRHVLGQGQCTTSCKSSHIYFAGLL